MRSKHSILRMDDGLRAQIDAAAEADKTTFSEWVRDACRAKLGNSVCLKARKKDGAQCTLNHGHSGPCGRWI